MDSRFGINALEETQEFMNDIPTGAIVLSKMDGHAKWGGALST